MEKYYVPLSKSRKVQGGRGLIVVAHIPVYAESKWMAEEVVDKMFSEEPSIHVGEATSKEPS